MRRSVQQLHYEWILFPVPENGALKLYYTVSQKKGATLSMAISLSIVDGFPKFCHRCKEQSISNKIHIRLPTTP